MKKIFVSVDDLVLRGQIIQILSSLYPEKVEFIEEEKRDEKANILIVSAEKMLVDEPVNFKKEFGAEGAVLIALSKMQSHLVLVEADYRLQDYQLKRFDEEAEGIFDSLLN